MSHQTDRAERLSYLQSMLGELRTMAETESCDMLAYLIDMAYIEATDIIRGDRPLGVRKDQGDGGSGVPLQAPGKIKFE